MHKIKMSDKFYYTIINILKLPVSLLTEINVTGLENLPKSGGVVIAPNHISEIDPILLGVELAPVRPIRALAKESLFKLPIVGKVLHGMGHVPVLRNSPSAAGALEKAVIALKEGKAVAIYPEGTIPVNLTKVGALKTGVAKASILSQKPVVLIGQWGAQNILPPKTKNSWKYVLKAIFTRPIHYVSVSEPIYPPVTTNFEPDEVHKLAVEFTSQIEQALESLTKPLRALAPAHPKTYKSVRK